MVAIVLQEISLVMASLVAFVFAQKDSQAISVNFAFLHIQGIIVMKMLMNAALRILVQMETVATLMVALCVTVRMDMMGCTAVKVYYIAIATSYHSQNVITKNHNYTFICCLLAINIASIGS